VTESMICIPKALLQKKKHLNDAHFRPLSREFGSKVVLKCSRFDGQSLPLHDYFRIRSAEVHVQNWTARFLYSV